MKRRISRLVCLLSHLHTTVPKDGPEAETTISSWLKATASSEGINRSILRRDLIFSNHYRGDGSTSRFASDALAASQGRGDDLLAAVNAKADETYLKEVIAGFVPRTLSAIWIEDQIQNHGLCGRLTTVLLRRSRDSASEMRSFVGLWLATWGNEGTFDAVLKTEGTVRVSVIIDFLKKKLRSEYYSRGQNPLLRMRGARTELEIRRRRQEGRDVILAGAPEWGIETQTVYDENESAVGFDFVDTTTESPEDALIRKDLSKARIEKCRSTLMENHPKAAERFVRIFDAMAQGQSRDEIAGLEDISISRAAKLVCEIRSELRISEISVEEADVILRAINDEPFSTREEIAESVKMDSDAIARCLRYLVETEIVSEKEGDSYVLTSRLSE